MPKEKTKQVTSGVRMSDELAAKLLVISSKEFVNQSEIIRKACEEFVKKYETKNGAITEDELKKAKAAMTKK